MTTAVTIDLAGGQLGGAARYRIELSGYLERRARRDIKVIGAQRHLTPGLAGGPRGQRGAAKPPDRAEQCRVHHARR